MTTTFEGRLGTAPEEAVKAPCVVASTSNITLSGEQTINSVSVTANDRVLVAGQTDASENGIYVAATGAWSRANDWNDAQDVVNGQLVATPNVIYEASFSGDFTPGTTEVTFSALGALASNTTVYELTTSIASNSHPGIVTGHIIETNYYDSNRAAGSGARWRYTGAANDNAALAGTGLHTDGYIYDADGKQFQKIGRINVRAFGVRPGADGTAGIVAAIAASANSGDPGTIYFLGSSSEYQSSPITIDTNAERIKFVGDGVRASILTIAGGSTGAGTSAIRATTADSSWMGFDGIRINAGSAYEDVVFINAPANQCTLRDSMLNAANLCDYCLHVDGGSIISLYDSYTTGANSHNFFSENQSTSSHVQLFGGNADIGTIGILKVESALAGPIFSATGVRFEGATSKDLFSFDIGAVGTFTLIGCNFSNGAAASVIQIQAASSSVDWTIQGCQFVNNPTLIVDDVDTPSNDVQFVSDSLDGIATSAAWFFKGAYFHGTNSVNAKARFQRTSSDVEYSLYARSQDDFRLTDETNGQDIFSITKSRFGLIQSRFANQQLTPSQITADQNNYNPGAAGFWRLSSDASRNITGIAGGEEGALLFIANVGAQDIVLQHESASSSAANRIITNTGAAVTLAANGTAILMYDSTSSRWRMIA